MPAHSKHNCMLTVIVIIFHTYLILAIQIDGCWNAYISLDLWDFCVTIFINFEDYEKLLFGGHIPELLTCPSWA